MSKSIRLVKNSYLNVFNQSLKRNKHTLIPINKELYNIKLYPQTQLKYIEQEMEQLTEKLNDITEGTKYETETLFQIMNSSSLQYYDNTVFNHASQLWNLSFFLQALSATQVPIKADLKKRLVTSFGSLQGFQTQFMAAAEDIFGNGWTWLVEDAKGELKIVNTVNSGNPLIPSRLQSIEGITSDVHDELISKLSWNVSKDKPKGYYIPILNLNMWQTGYVLDHGHHVKRYVNTFLNCLDWNVVHQRLIRDKY